MEVALTTEELTEFTPINRAAVDYLMIKAQEPDGSISPCWLCMSPDARSQAREDLLSYTKEKMNRGHRFGPELQMNDLETLVVQTPGIDEQIDKWKKAELSLKKARQDGNPRAYFME